MVNKNFRVIKHIKIPQYSGRRGEGARLHTKVFNKNDKDESRQATGNHDWIMAILIRIANRLSVESGLRINISDLTELEPQAIEV